MEEDLEGDQSPWMDRMRRGGNVILRITDSLVEKSLEVGCFDPSSVTAHSGNAVCKSGAAGR
jgi:hypothetical protein